jgi:nucleoid-associated protein YgaU
MTRETKIGLLVGLAFIIVLGILISDHLSNTNESPLASLQNTGSTVRGALGEPSDNDVAPLLRQPMAIVPRQHVPTREEVTHRSSGGGVTLAVPSSNGLGETSFTQPHSTVQQPTGETPAERIRREAIARGEEVETVPGTGEQAIPPVKTTALPPAPVQPKTLATSYVAKSGDTLGTIALHALGANNKANREAIVAANPSLQSNRNLIVAGRTYAVPAGSNARSATPSPVTQMAQETVAPPVAPAGAVYVVQSGDTLWSIAVNELGSASEVGAIKDLNQDLLGDSDQVRPNMKLHLPGKKVAAAN